MKLASVLIASLPALVAASPQGDCLAKKIESTYNPQITADKTGSSWSLYGCTVEDFVIWGQDPVNLKSRAVKVSLYHARGAASPAPAVIILPPTGGVNILDRGYANELCSSGITAALVSGWDSQNEISLDFNMHNNGALRALAATRHVVEMLETQKFNSIGVLGTSIGAIAGALTYGVEPRISAAALIVGSARFADVVADSDEAGATKLRKERMTQLGIPNEEAYREAVRKAVYIEPAELLENAKNRKALVMSADSDTTVRSDYQFELAQALNAEHIRLHGNHLQGIKDAFFSHRRDITTFFAKALAK